MADWGNIPIDLAIKIAELIEFLEDLEMFGFVCRRWRSAAEQAKFGANATKSSTQARVPWLMLPETDDTSNQRRFYSLYNHKVRHVSLPLLNTHVKRLLSSHGWLLSVTEVSKNLCLLNPLSGAVVNLPMVRFGLRYCDYGVTLFEKFILSGNPSSTDSDFSVALILAESYENLSGQVIAFWSKDDDEWDLLLDHRGCGVQFTFCNDIAFYRGFFYSVGDDGRIWRFEIDRSGGDPRESVVTRLNGIPCGDDYGTYTSPDSPSQCKYYRILKIYYLVESDDRLLLVCRVRRLVDNCYRTTSFEVFELDVDNWEAKKVGDLKDVAIFVGWNSSFSAKVSIEHDGCKSNSIYFTDDFRIDCYHMRSRFNSNGKDMGIYDLADERIDSYYDGPSHYSEYAPFMWYEAPTSCSY